MKTADEEIKPGSLVIVVEVDDKPPKHCWGLVKGLTPAGCYIVQTGSKKEDSMIATDEQLIFVLQTNGKFNTPDEAVAANIHELLLYVTLISHTAHEIRALRRYKRRVEGKLRRGFTKRILGAIRRL